MTVIAPQPIETTTQAPLGEAVDDPTPDYASLVLEHNKRKPH